STGHSGMAGMPETSSAATPAAGHNQQDVTFAQNMVAHHGQAIDMAKLAPSRSTNTKVLDLANRIEQAQGPEIEQMRGWLAQWGAPGMNGSMPGMPGMPTMPDMPGLMSDSDMTRLEQARGTDFDRLFLRLMTQHHQGAIDMAKTELAQGGDAGAKALAQKIIDAQQAEITEMQTLLAQL